MLRTLAMTLAVLWAPSHDAWVDRQTDYLPGVFVGTPHGPVELTAYAEVVTNGQLRMARGSFENVPTLSDVQRILCNVPNWQPGAIFVATQDIFRDERAERREVRFALRRLNVSALELRVEDIERPDRLADLVRSVGASQQSRAYVFIVMTTSGLSRFYPFRVRIE